MKYTHIFFDLDGTLTDPGEGITNSVAYALERFGIGNKDRSELYPYIGPPLIDSFEKFAGLSREDAVKALGIYREYFTEKGMFENKVYEGAEGALTALRSKGLTLVLATSKPEPYAKRILDHFSLSSYFDLVVGASMDEKLSKKEEVIALALEKCRVSREKVLMVGDRDVDVLGAAANGISALGVLYGYGSKEELTQAGAAHFADSIEDVSRWILEQ